jgi:TolB-like protein
MVLVVTATPTIAVVEFSKVDVSSELSQYVGEHLAQSLGDRGLKVVTAKDIAALIGVERQKELLGCSTTSATCDAELVQALGSDYLLTGTIAKLGSLIQVNVKLLDPGTGQAKVTWQDSVGDQSRLPVLLNAAAEAIADKLVPRKPLGPMFWVPVVAGAALVVGGAVSFGLEEQASAMLAAQASAGVLSEADGRMFRDRGKVTQVLAPVLTGLGVAALAVGFISLAFRSDVAVAIVPGANGLVVSLGGVL